MATPFAGVGVDANPITSNGSTISCDTSRPVAPCRADGVPARRPPLAISAARSYGPRQGSYDMGVDRSSAVRSLAHAYSQASSIATLPKFDGTDPALDPNSDHFSALKWARSIAGMLSRRGVEPPRPGICFRDLNVYGHARQPDYQMDVGNVWRYAIDLVRRLMGTASRPRTHILNHLDGVLREGETLLVLGSPESGRSTLLRTLSGELEGLTIDPVSSVNYRGISTRDTHSMHRGEAIYIADSDDHFPHLTVGDTLSFVARARRLREIPKGLNELEFTQHLRDVAMAIFGIAHTSRTRVGNAYVSGTSGGERRRVTIAEAALVGAPLQFWDNSTRGLDSANSIQFCRALRLQSDVFGTVSCAALSQVPEAAYGFFHKVTVLHDGRQIYFGPTDAARQYFVDLGFECHQRQTTPGFLASILSPSGCTALPGFEGKLPRTADELAAIWKASSLYRDLHRDAKQSEADHPSNDGLGSGAFISATQTRRSRRGRKQSSYSLSYTQQIHLCLWRCLRRFASQPYPVVVFCLAAITLYLIIASINPRLADDTSDIGKRSVIIFGSLYVNSIMGLFHIYITSWQRSVVQKHKSYAIHRPSAEIFASWIADIPLKLLSLSIAGTAFYYIVDLRRDAGAFFIFLLIQFACLICQSLMFQFCLLLFRSFSVAIIIAAFFVEHQIVFSGFAIVQQDMWAWLKWTRYLLPCFFAFEALMVNEYLGRSFPCSEFAPSTQWPRSLPNLRLNQYTDVRGDNHICNIIGAVMGQELVAGDRYLRYQYQFEDDHRWRNFGILVALMVAAFLILLIIAELFSTKRTIGWGLVYRRPRKGAFLGGFLRRRDCESDISMSSSGPTPSMRIEGPRDEEAAGGPPQLLQGSTLQWSNVCYEVTIKGEKRRVLDQSHGWIKPGTLTALMGASGAGKTTLLEALANFLCRDDLTGDIFVAGGPPGRSYRRQVGFTWQHDILEPTATVRETLLFHAALRDPNQRSRKENLVRIEEITRLVGLEGFINAVVGLPGQGLNGEQRKRLSIGTELAAGARLLLMDEVASGLESERALAIVELLRDLAIAGHSVLCSIHQPSVAILQRFDRLLLMTDRGKTVYFGDLGDGAKNMTDYFQRNGGGTCPASANPAEWALDTIASAAPGSSGGIDWARAWAESPEYQSVKAELERMQSASQQDHTSDLHSIYLYQGQEYAASFLTQLRESVFRAFSRLWRRPGYIYGKLTASAFLSVFFQLGFLDIPNSIQSKRSETFAILSVTSIDFSLLQYGILPMMKDHSFFEAREHKSRLYSWPVFILTQVLVELPWSCLAAVACCSCWYYTAGLNRFAGASGQVAERTALAYLYILSMYLFNATYIPILVACFESPVVGTLIGTSVYFFGIISSGVFFRKVDLAKFWVVIYRINPFSYLLGGLLASVIANSQIDCADEEHLRFRPAGNQTCGAYMAAYIEARGGRLLDERAMDLCAYCPIAETNSYLSDFGVKDAHRWRNLAIISSFSVFNVAVALCLYWLIRAPRKRSRWWWMRWKRSR